MNSTLIQLSKLSVWHSAVVCMTFVSFVSFSLLQASTSKTMFVGHMVVLNQCEFAIAVNFWGVCVKYTVSLADSCYRLSLALTLWPAALWPVLSVPLPLPLSLPLNKLTLAINSRWL